MNDLIINGIDHSAFDLDWAKRGGWCIVRGEVCKLISKATYISSDTDTLFVRAIAERMATREECAVAGIEYIEPPARWLPIESAPKDGSRILIKEYGTVFVAGWGYVVDDIYGWVIVNDCYIEHSDNLLWMEHPKDK